jgi:predicted metal-dependent phosphoesterase TrpH
MAHEARVHALALTDHDCLDGLAEFTAAARGFDPVPGVEISARRDDRDVHILGLFIDPADPVLRRRLEDLAAHRVERVRTMAGRLQALGFDVTEGEIRRIAGKGTVGRPHVAQALVEAGAAASFEDAFRRLLKPGRPAYVPKPGPAPEEVVGWVHEAGGVAVLAHPGLIRRDGWIEPLSRAGLDGIEVWHPKHNPVQRRTYLDFARRLHLVPAGGSDYHGARVGDARIGQEPVPLETLERLRARRP